MSFRAHRAGRPVLVAAVAVAAVVVAGRIWLLATPPEFSDIPAYQHDAALWGAAGEQGVSFYGLHGQYVIDVSEALGHEPPEGTTLLEYPPLAVSLMAALNAGLPSSAHPDDPAQLAAYAWRYRLVAFAVDLIMLGVLGLVSLRGRPSKAGRDPPGPHPAFAWPYAVPWRLAVYGAGGAAIYYILYDRLDLFEGALLLASLLALVRGWWRAALLILAVAIAFKVYPAVLAPLWLVASLPAAAVAAGARDPRRLLRPLAVRAGLLGIAVIALFVPFLVVQGPDALQFVAFNAQRGVQLESVGAAALLLLEAAGTPLQIVFRYGAYEVVNPLAPAVASVSFPLTALVVIVVGLMFLRTVRRDLAPLEPGDPAGDRILAAHLPGLVTLAAVATLMTVLVTAKVLSPQYFLWLLPLVPLLEGGRGTRLWQVGFVVLLALSTVVFPGLYSAGPLVFAIIVRDTVLVGLAIAACALLAAPRRAVPRDLAPSSS